MRTFVLAATAAAAVASVAQAQPAAGLGFLGRSGPGGAESVAYDPINRLAYANTPTQVRVFDLANPAAPVELAPIPIPGANSVAVRNGLLAISAENTTTRQDPGTVFFYDSATRTLRGSATVGAVPDQVTFAPDGRVLVANEGEPNSYGQPNSVDPEGSVSIITVTNPLVGAFGTSVATAGFTPFNSDISTLRAAGVRIFGPGATVAQDLEPEYIAVSPDGTTAYVSIQEANAVGVLDLNTNAFTAIRPLGLKDHSLAGNGLDASDRDVDGTSAGGGLINIQPWPVFGMYQPDAIASFQIGSQTYYITANEGDARDYTGFSEEVRVGAGSYDLDNAVFPNEATLKQNINLGRLTVTNQTGNTDADDQFEQIVAFGARSFTIWDAATGALVFDSGDQLEQITLSQNAANFNSDGVGGGVGFDTRSDNKGPEPEAVAVGTYNGRTYAVIGLERIGDIMLWDITDPTAPTFVQYVDLAGDIGPEVVQWIDAALSPTGLPLVIVGSEISGTLSVFQVPEPATIALLGLGAAALLRRRK